MNAAQPAVKALFFDVFGSLVDWRTSVAREAEKILRPQGKSIDWTAFADAWRGEYQPGLEEVRSGKIPFSKLDVLHRRGLERLLPRAAALGLRTAHIARPDEYGPNTGEAAPLVPVEYAAKDLSDLAAQLGV